MAVHSAQKDLVGAKFHVLFFLHKEWVLQVRSEFEKILILPLPIEHISVSFGSMYANGFRDTVFFDPLCMSPSI
jgi:hypothetical protein